MYSVLANSSWKILVITVSVILLKAGQTGGALCAFLKAIVAFCEGLISSFVSPKERGLRVSTADSFVNVVV